jgi:hypothetical protein
MYQDAYEGAEYDEVKGLVVFHSYCHMYRQGELVEKEFLTQSIA